MYNVLISLFLLCCICPIILAKCPAGYTEGQNPSFCYKFIGEPIDFVDAEALCASAPNGHLASVANIFVNAFFDQTSKEIFPRATTQIWIGGYYQSTWTWTDGTNFTYVNWDKGQPGTGQCLAMQLASGKWDSVDCNTMLPYICEIPNTGSDGSCTTSIPVVGTSTSSPTSPCPNTAGWFHSGINNKCYYAVFEYQAYEWTDINSRCNSLKATMVSIHSYAENTIISGIMSYILDGRDFDKAWVGLYLSGDYWHWTDNTPVDFTNWDFGNPGSDIYGMLIGKASDGQLGWKAYSDGYNFIGVVLCQINI